MKKNKVKKVAFQLRKKVGDHNEDGVNYAAGSIVMSNRNLVKLFRNKFDRVHPDEDFDFAEACPNIPSARTVLNKGKEEGKGPSPKSKRHKDSKKFGENVTLSYPAALDAELEVYEKDHWYSVVDRNTESGKPELLSGKKLREKDLDSFLKRYVEPDDDGDEDDDEDE